MNDESLIISHSRIGQIGILSEKDLYFFNFILQYYYIIIRDFGIILYILKIIYKGFSFMDTRLFVIALPLLVAASWALYNIGRLAIQQVQRLSR